MTGCYRCGLPEGSSERLCETCYHVRFHRAGSHVMAADDTQVEGAIELSPRANRAVLVSGLLLYLAVVGACALTMGRPILPVEQARFEFVLDGQATQTPERSRAFGRVEVLNHNLPSGQRE